MQWKARHIAVVGLGQSGLSAAQLCLARGARVTLWDEAPAAKAQIAAAPLLSQGAQLRCGAEAAVALAATGLNAFDTVVVSPGVPARTAFEAAAAAGCEVIGELELASRVLTAPILLVGGTNGKSTVTAWTAAMLTAAGNKVFVGGNFGTPLSAAVGAGDDVLVVEISSFQAERVPSLRARAHALLNITEDHLDRYVSFAAYAHAKGNPFANMTAEDVAVLPAGDGLCAEQAARGAARVVTFSQCEDGALVSPHAGELLHRGRGDAYALDSLRVKGRHNVANACAAVALASSVGAPRAAIAQALASFAGLDHRHELVAEVAGVRFYNDSKATNVGAVVAALGGMAEARAVLIAGGRDKHGDYAPLVEALRARGRAAVLIGEAAARIAAAIGAAVPWRRADSLEEAVHIAADLANSGDGVLLSPACSSYDMFPSYKARGDAFVAAVRRLEEDSP